MVPSHHGAMQEPGEGLKLALDPHKLESASHSKAVPGLASPTWHEADCMDTSGLGPCSHMSRSTVTLMCTAPEPALVCRCWQGPVGCPEATCCPGQLASAMRSLPSAPRLTLAPRCRPCLATVPLRKMTDPVLLQASQQCLERGRSRLGCHWQGLIAYSTACGMCGCAEASASSM